MNDITGKEFRIGDHVAYPIRRGSYMWMQQGIITRLGENRLWVKRLTGSDRSHVISCWHRVVIIARVDS